MKKYIILILCLSVFTCICYLYIDKPVIDNRIGNNIKTVLFFDKEQNLVPISTHFYDDNSKMNLLYNKIDIMKSDDFVEKGLFPVFDESLQVLSLDVKDKHVSMHLYSLNNKKIDFKVIESLCYILRDILPLSKLDILFHSESSDNSPISYKIQGLNNQLGINNFVDSSLYLHESKSVEIYQDKLIENISYLVPTTYRINNQMSLQQQVDFVLKVIDKSIVLKDTELRDDILYVELEDNILNDNEKISLDLETKVVLSLMTLSDFKNIAILINDEDVRNDNNINIVINYSHIL